MRPLTKWLVFALVVLPLAGCARTVTSTSIPPYRNLRTIVLVDGDTVRVRPPRVASLEGDSVVVRHRATLARLHATPRDSVASVGYTQSTSTGTFVVGLLIAGVTAALFVMD